MRFVELLAANLFESEAAVLRLEHKKVPECDPLVDVEFVQMKALLSVLG